MRTSRAFCLSCLLVCTGLNAQTLPSFLANLEHLPLPIRIAAVDSFLARHPSAPVFENDSTVVFIFVGGAVSVAVAGDANAWSPRTDTMVQLEGTPLWWMTKRFEPDARLDYKLVLDGSQWILDPRNTRVSQGGFGPNSELAMPRTPDHPETHPRLGIPRGTIIDSTVWSSLLKNERLVRLYLPPGYSSGSDSVGLVVVHDGLEFISIAGMPAILDNLIADGTIPPVITLFIPPVDREPEYAGGRIDTFASFVAEELVPSLLKRYRIRHDPAMRVVLGASNGGNISLFLAMRYSGVFGGVAAFSSNVTGVIDSTFRHGPRLPISLYLNLGIYDIPVLLPRVRSLVIALSAAGYSFAYREIPDGHSWTNWKNHVGDALVTLLNPAAAR